MNLDIAGILLSTDMFYALQQKGAGESYGSPLMWGVMLILQDIGIESVWHHRIHLFLASFNRNLHGWTYVSQYFRRYLISNRLLGGFNHVLFSPPYWWRMILESNFFPRIIQPTAIWPATRRKMFSLHMVASWQGHNWSPLLDTSRSSYVCVCVWRYGQAMKLA